MKYLPLFKVALRHSYYSDQGCPDFDLETSVETERLLENHRCVRKTLEDGFTILITVDEEGRPFIPLSSDATFLFHLRLRNQNFSYFTDLSAFSGIDDPLYSNTTLMAGETTLPLSAGQETPTETVVRVPPLNPPPVNGTFAALHILNNDTLSAEGLPLPDVPVFYIDFLAKQARWSYYCVTDLSPTLGEFTIEDKASAVSERLIFSDENRQDLGAEEDAEDGVAQMLEAQYPDFRTIRFLSDALIPCRQAARQQIEFHMGENRLSEALPNPSFKNNAKLSVTDGDASEEEEILFQVIKYLSV